MENNAECEAALIVVSMVSVMTSVVDECRAIHHCMYRQSNSGQGQHRRLNGRLSYRLTCESFHENREGKTQESCDQRRGASSLDCWGNDIEKYQPENRD